MARRKVIERVLTPKILPASPLSKVLANLTQRPRLKLVAPVQGLTLTLAQRNDHFGARHFLKEALPRIRYANPDLEISVNKVKKSIADSWRPELEVKFEDGKVHTLNLHEKWSSAIVKELMDLAGTATWEAWKAEAGEAGAPLVPGEEHEAAAAERARERTAPPSLKTFLATRPPPAPKKAEMPVEAKEEVKVEEKPPVPDTRGPRPTSGPGAILPWD